MRRPSTEQFSNYFHFHLEKVRLTADFNGKLCDSLSQATVKKFELVLKAKH